MKKEIDLSIIIINFGNTKEYTRKCLASLSKAISKLNTEVIVVDNISNDGTREMIKKDFPKAIYIRKEEPHGFGENNNFGIKIAKGRYILLLNSDTEIIDENIFVQMTAWLDRNPKVAVCTSALVCEDKKTLQGSGGSLPDLFRVFLWLTFLDDIPFIDRLITPFHPLHPNSFIGRNDSYFTKEHQQDWVTGAFYMIRKEVLKDSGVFDEDFNAYVEEVDLSYRIKKLGWQIWYLPQWKTLHYGGVSYGSENSIVFEMKNLKLFYKKHYPKWQLSILNILIKVGLILRIVLFFVINPKLSKIYAKAYKTV